MEGMQLLFTGTCGMCMELTLEKWVYVLEAKRAEVIVYLKIHGLFQLRKLYFLFVDWLESLVVIGQYFNLFLLW